MRRGEAGGRGWRGEPSSGLATGKRALLPLGSELHQSPGSWLNGSRLHAEARERKTKCNVGRDETALCVSVRARVCVGRCKTVKVSRRIEEKTFGCRSGDFCRTKRDSLVYFSSGTFLWNFYFFKK